MGQLQNTTNSPAVETSVNMSREELNTLLRDGKFKSTGILETGTPQFTYKGKLDGNNEVDLWVRQNRDGSYAVTTNKENIGPVTRAAGLQDQQINQTSDFPRNFDRSEAQRPQTRQSQTEEQQIEDLKERLSNDPRFTRTTDNQGTVTFTAKQLTDATTKQPLNNVSLSFQKDGTISFTSTSGGTTYGAAAGPGAIMSNMERSELLGDINQTLGEPLW